MEGGKTVYQGWIDGKSAEEIRNDTIKNMNKGLADAVNDASIDSVVPDGLVGTGLKSLTNNVLNNPNED